MVGTIFEIERNDFKQKFCIAMGSPLSPVLAALYMEYFESTLLLTFFPAPSAWLRYVGDVMVLGPGYESFESFLADVNALAHSINFTVQ